MILMIIEINANDVKGGGRGVATNNGQRPSPLSRINMVKTSTTTTTESSQKGKIIFSLSLSLID